MARAMDLAVAFAVVLATLVVQGLTLRVVMTWLHLKEDDTVEREVRLARLATLRAALAATDGSANNERVKFIRDWYESQLRRAEQGLRGEADRARSSGSRPDTAHLGSEVVELVRASVQAERQRLVQLRAEGIIGDAAFQRVEEQLDWAELTFAQLK